MSYHVMRTAKGRLRIVLEDEPLYCRALAAAPPAREPELGNGPWLVMVFAAWSMPDIRAIQTALDAVKRFGGALQLGVRPFDDPAEHRAWCPGLAGDGNTPVWVLLSDGTVLLEREGLLTVDMLLETIKAACPGIIESEWKND